MKWRTLFLGLYLVACTAWAGSEPSKWVRMDFPNTDIRAFIGYVSDVTGRNFIVDPDVKGSITVVAPDPVPIGEVLGFFQSVLEVHGYTTIDAGNMMKIIPSAEASGRAVETITESEPEKASDSIILNP